ncbi:MAG TPA: cation:proton antiporter [Candidatus Omnitrophota bacterium]|nr:cation:proton antiporter [Candidatus Omnitrophota bacterium]
MADYSFLTEFLTILLIATLVAFTFERFRLPAILGYLLAGILIGPHGFGLLSDVARIYSLAELGVVLLMLTIGLEITFDRLKGFGRIAILGGMLQIVLSVILALLFAFWKGWSPYEGFFLGSVIALSSTAIVLKFLIDRGEVATPYGRIAVSILIFQDLAVVPLMIFINGSGAAPGVLLHTLAIAFGKTLLLLGCAILFARYLLPRFLHEVALSRNREIFFLTSVVICLGVAWASGRMGLSLAVGAFFAGVMFANSDFGDQLTGELLPFRHIFVSIFFVSIGMLFDVRFAFENFLTLAAMVGLVLLINFVLMTFLVAGFGYPLRVAIATGIILSQIGEFSFLLLEAGRNSGGIDPHLYQLLLSTAFLTMFMTPFLFALVSPIMKASEKLPFMGFSSAAESEGNEPSRPENHVILCGFGPPGHDLAMAFREENIPFVLVEMNPNRVKHAREMGVSVIYGDAVNEGVMRRAGIERARAVVVSFGDSLGMEQIIRVVQRLNSGVTLVVRTRYEQDVAHLYDLEADVVIMEEWEAGHELNRVVLELLDIAPDRQKNHLERIIARKELMIEEAILKRSAEKSN